ncbi:MAG: cell division protein FtsQ/DivIB [Candidatus Omnitrophica bacterium]|nr:cell division protein FtsQ/DivIB [Candidatus Omnitrophota bacterium]
MKKKKVDLIIKLGIAVIIFSGLWFASIAVYRILKKSDYFAVTDIFIKGDDTINLSYLKGKNIFSIDLKKEARRILSECPDSKNVKIVIVPPNRLYVNFLKRKPIALVKLHKIFAVDNEGVLFYADNDINSPELPLITGLGRKIFAPKAGKDYNIPELKFALSLIKELRTNKSLRKYGVNKIDVSNSTFAVLMISSLEVRIAYAKIKENIYILGEIFRRSADELTNLKYVDLRFTDPIIKLKNDK